jgi:hypothetical protein
MKSHRALLCICGERVLLTELGVTSSIARLEEYTGHIGRIDEEG